MADKPTLITPEGYDSLNAEINRLNNRRPALVAELSRARDMGDRSENGAYKAARAALSRHDSRSRYLQSTRDRAKIMDKPQDGTVGLGSTVLLDEAEHSHEFTIVGTFEADIATRKLSHLSPLGRLLMGKSAGDSVSLDLPHGKRSYKIIAVR